MATYDDNAHMHLGSSQIQEAQWGHIVTSSQPAVCDGQGLAGCQEDARGSVSGAIALSSYWEDGKCGSEQLSAHNQCIATQPLSDVTHMALNRVVGTHMWWPSTSWWHTSSGTVPMAGGFFHP